MQATISKWGNSLGLRIPKAMITTLNLREGDKINYDVETDRVVLTKEKTTKQLFEEFYGKPFDQIDVGNGSEIDWGENIGGEIF